MPQDDRGGGSKPVGPLALDCQALAGAPRWQQPCVTKPAGTVSMDFQAATGTGALQGGLQMVYRQSVGARVDIGWQMMGRQKVG